MLSVSKVNNNITHGSNATFGYKLSSFGNNSDAQKAYLNMNKDVYVDFVDGDISLLGYLAGKLQNYWNIIINKDPSLELKARIIEENLKANARREIQLDRVA